MKAKTMFSLLAAAVLIWVAFGRDDDRGADRNFLQERDRRLMEQFIRDLPPSCTGSMRATPGGTVIGQYICICQPEAACASDESGEIILRNGKVVAVR